jgi:hypothetical protein
MIFVTSTAPLSSAAFTFPPRILELAVQRLVHAGPSERQSRLDRTNGETILFLYSPQGAPTP